MNENGMYNLISTFVDCFTFKLPFKSQDQPYAPYNTSLDGLCFPSFYQICGSSQIIPFLRCLTPGVDPFVGAGAGAESVIPAGIEPCDCVDPLPQGSIPAGITLSAPAPA